MANTRVVGAVIAKLLRALRWTANARYSTMHLIGYSLGAHVAGYAAERIRSIGRISGKHILPYIFRQAGQHKHYKMHVQIKEHFSHEN